jgi:hypothetical protein
MADNPLVATKDTHVDAWEGVWIAQDIEQLGHGIKNGDWVDTTIGAISLGLDGLAAISDPVSTLLQYGVAWIIEHVKPLSEALNWLAGDPAQINANAETWTRIATELLTRSEDLTRDVKLDLAEWTGESATAYRDSSTRQQHALAGLAKASEAMSLITMGAGALISTVRLIVRDLIAACVARLIVYAAEEAASIGFATPLVVEQVATTVASWAAKIAKYLKALLASIRRLMPIIRRLGELINELKRIMAAIHDSAPRLLSSRRGPRTPYDGPRRQGIDAEGLMWNRNRLVASFDNLEKVAAKFGIDLDGVKISIDRNKVSAYDGETFRNGSVKIYVPGFDDDLNLAKTLVHELYHVNHQVRRGIPFPKPGEDTAPWEKPAEEWVEQWWRNHPLNPLNQ